MRTGRRVTGAAIVALVLGLAGLGGAFAATWLNLGVATTAAEPKRPMPVTTPAAEAAARVKAREEAKRRAARRRTRRTRTYYGGGSTRSSRSRSYGGGGYSGGK